MLLIEQKLNLLKEINKTISDFYSGRKLTFNDSNYQSKFANTGARKALPVIEYVKARFQNLEQLVYVSIGGADGSEIAYVLENTSIKHGILLEYSDDGANHARIEAERLAKIGKYLTVLQGDAYMRLDDCCPKLEFLRSNNNICGIICSAQAVLHELPFRSPGYNLSLFFGRLFRGFDIKFFYSREPAAINSWPDTVKIRIGGLPSYTVAGMARLLVDHLDLPRGVFEVGDNYVELSRSAAVEVLRKILYFDSQSHFIYEMGECHEKFDADLAAQIIGATFSNRPLEVHRINSDTFSLLYDQLEIEARQQNGNALPLPPTFAILRGFNLPKKNIVSTSGGTFPLPSEDQITQVKKKFTNNT